MMAVLHAGTSGFKWKAGEHQLSAYESSVGNNRVFCSGCGSRMPVIQGAHISIPVGTLDCEPGVSPVAHVYCASKPEWQKLSDNLPNYQALPPESFWTKSL